ncbi:hypothetical protein EIP86_009271 [Pleurotus ostreatoroseus]|nr:hypothetical protein EIP86_009271 [Pleurotus ostreatoroseus]
MDNFQDILSLMSTCRDLRAAGLPYIFNSRMEICCDKKLASICKFLLVDAPRRLLFLRQLAVLTYPEKPETVDLYLQVLQQARHLEDIEVWCGLPSIDPRIHTAVSSLTGIKTLTVRNLLFREAGLLRRMQSPVRKVDISFQYYDQPIDPIWLLSKLAPTLESLRVVLGTQQRAFPQAVYPSLRTLVAESCVFERIAPLVDAFPNLRDLTIFSYRDEESSEEVIRDRRENLEAQRTRSWGPMDRVLGDVLMLYRLGLSCSIRRLEIPWLESTRADSWTPSCKDMFSSILSDTRPSVLTLILRPATFEISQFPSFIAQAPVTLGKLIITTYITGSTDAASAIDHIITALKPLKITHFVLRVKWYNCRRGPPAQDMHPTEQYLKRTNTKELAQRAMHVSASLRYFLVDLAGQDMTYWSFEESTGPDERTIRELPATMAESVMVGERF